MSTSRNEFTRDEIISTAKRLFAENGIRNTPVGKISEALGMTRAAVYYYFASKEDLVQQVLNALLPKYRFWDQANSEMSIEGFAEALIIERYRQIAREGPTDLRFFHLVMLEQSGLPGGVQMRMEIDRANDAMKRALRAGQERGEIRRPLDFDAIATAVVTDIMGLDTMWLVYPESVDVVCAAEAIAQRFIASVKAEP